MDMPIHWMRDLLILVGVFAGAAVFTVAALWFFARLGGNSPPKPRRFICPFCGHTAIGYCSKCGRPQT